MISPELESIRRHLEGLAEVAASVAVSMPGEIVDAADLVVDCLEAGGKLLFCGNGGSAADAQHLATEYVVRFRDDRQPLAAMALTTDTSLLTAAGNDYGFERVFARQVEALGRPGDVLFLHSTSGRSPNLLAAARAAKEAGVRTIAMLGGGGGPLKELVDLAVVVPTSNGAHAQELHVAIGHAICELVEHRLRADREEA